MSIDELIEQLPEKQYGERTREELVEAIRNGDVSIEPGSNLPVLRELDGKPVKGGGRPQRKDNLALEIRRLREHENNRDWFDREMLRTLEDGKSVRQAVFDKGLEDILSGKMGSDRLVRWYLENHTGKAKESSNSALSILAERLLEALVGEIPATIEGEWTELED